MTFSKYDIFIHDLKFYHQPKTTNENVNHDKSYRKDSVACSHSSCRPTNKQQSPSYPIILVWSAFIHLKLVWSGFYLPLPAVFPLWLSSFPLCCSSMRLHSVCPLKSWSRWTGFQNCRNQTVEINYEKLVIWSE